jgi:hypothetical protein
MIFWLKQSDTWLDWKAIFRTSICDRIGHHNDSNVNHYYKYYILRQISHHATVLILLLKTYWHKYRLHQTCPRDLINISWETCFPMEFYFSRVFKNCITGKYEEILVNTFHFVKYRVILQQNQYFVCFARKWCQKIARIMTKMHASLRYPQ